MISGLTGFDGFSGDAGAFAQLHFALDFADGLRRNVNELHADANAGQTVTDFAARTNFGAGQCETEAEIEHRAFGEPRRGIKKHPASAHVGRANSDLLGTAFVVNRDFLYGVNARAEPHAVPLWLMIVGFHWLTPSSTADCCRNGESCGVLFSPQ